MAKFGEGDPRWLVQDRADGANVNNWHWSEKDCIDWCTSTLSHLFQDFTCLDDAEGFSLVIRSLESCTGEAFINIRKNKIIPSYELQIKLRWDGNVKDGTGNIVSSPRGSILLPYVADENHDEEPEISVSCETADAASQRLKQAFLSKGKKAFLARLTEFVTKLRAGGPAVDGEAGKSPADASPTKGAPSSGAPKASPPDAAAPPPAPAASSSTGATKKLSLSEKFYCAPGDLFECFTVSGRVQAFTQSPAVVEPRVGGSFSWFGGSVAGEFVELVPGKSLKMRWRFNTWEDGCYSTVSLTLECPTPGTTIAKLEQDGIPETDKFGNGDVFDAVERGWKAQIFMRIRQVFGYGV